MGSLLFGLVTGAGLTWAFMRRRCSNSPPPCINPAPPDWRRSFTHENLNRPGGPPPLKLRRSEPDLPEQFIRMDEGHTQRGNGSGGPSTPKPPIKPQPSGGHLIREAYRGTRAERVANVEAQ